MALLPTVYRQRLIDECSNADLRVVKLIAPAGYGKSTLARALLAKRQGSATADLARVTTEIDVVREVVDAALRTTDEERRTDYAAQSVAFGADLGGWMRLAADAMRLLDSSSLLVENAEAIAGNTPAARVLESLVMLLPATAALIICARVEPDLHLSQFASPARTRVIGPGELQFDRREIAEVFSTVTLKQRELDEVERFTRGWPMVVMMLFALARRGRLDAYLRDDRDIADLYGYLAEQVFNTLDAAQRDLLDAMSAVPDVTESDLRMLFGKDGYEDTLQRLERDTPFVTRVAGEQIEVHPAMRQMLAARGDPDTWRAKFFERVDRGDSGVRAAQIALLRGRFNDAAETLNALAQPYLLAAPSPGVSTILGSLPDEALSRYPLLWNAAVFLRASFDIAATMRQGEEIVAAFTAETSVPERLGVYNVLAQLYANRGQDTSVRRIASRLRDDPFLADIPVASLLARFWEFLIAVYHGDPMDLSLLKSDFAPVIESPATDAFVESIVIAADRRLHGDRWGERGSLERSIEIAHTTSQPVVIAICLQHAAWGAWFWGDDRQCQLFADEMANAVNSAVINQFFLFLDAFKGRALGTATGSEALGDRACAYLVAASKARSQTERLRLIDEAMVAAEQSSRRFPGVLARIAQAYSYPSLRNEALRQAEVLAEETQSRELIRAVRSISDRTAELGMLTAFAAPVRTGVRAKCTARAHDRASHRPRAIRDGDLWNLRSRTRTAHLSSP